MISLKFNLNSTVLTSVVSELYAIQNEFRKTTKSIGEYRTVFIKELSYDENGIKHLVLNNKFSLVEETVGRFSLYINFKNNTRLDSVQIIADLMQLNGYDFPELCTKVESSFTLYLPESI